MKQIFVQFIDNIRFKIVYQTHVEQEFEPDGVEQIIEGFFLKSNGYPEVFEDGLFVLGKDRGWEDSILLARSDKWKKNLIKAVNKYNEIHK